MLESYSAGLLRWAAATVLVTGMHVGGGAFALVHWNDKVPEESAGSIAIELAPVPVAPPVEQTNLAHGPLLEEAAPTALAVNQPVEKAEKETELAKVEPSPLAPEPEVVLPIQKATEETKPSEQSQQPLSQPQPSQQTSAALTTAPPHVATKASVTTAAPTLGTSAIPASLRTSWQKAVISHLNRFKRYPDSARTRGIEGLVKVEFTIDGEGRIVASHVAQSSGSPVLDAEALATLQRADPLPAPPGKTAEATFYLVLPIHFRMR